MAIPLSHLAPALNDWSLPWRQLLSSTISPSEVSRCNCSFTTFLIYMLHGCSGPWAFPTKPPSINSWPWEQKKTFSSSSSMKSQPMSLNFISWPWNHCCTLPYSPLIPDVKLLISLWHQLHFMAPKFQRARSKYLAFLLEVKFKL